MVELAPWRSPMSRALHLNRALPYARYCQLATVRNNGTPANRTVVFRGFSTEGHLQIVTDQRSEKIQHITQCPWGEICWYFPKTREQFRLSGRVTNIDVDCSDENLSDIRKSLWNTLSDKARAQFAWPFPSHNRENHAAFNRDAPAPDAPLAQFCVLLLAPHRVDHLELRGNPQDRCIYELNNDTNEWRVRIVNP
ncbi:MAG: Npun_F5749 family FMN-dependent PPOX-type flavoprotein [Cyanobacteria bacterium P01_E01_bin.6]